MNKKIDDHIDEYDGATADIAESLLPELDAAQKKLDLLSCQLNGQNGGQSDRSCKSGESRLLAAIASMTEGVVLVNEAGTIEMANPLAQRLLGLAAGSDASDVKAALESLGIRNFFAVQNDPVQKNENEFIGKTRGGKILRVKWNAVRDDHGRFMGNIAMLRDITAQIELDRSQTEFIAAISHELRTPLTTMQNSVSNMLVGVTGKTTPKMQQYLNTMQGDCQRLARLINDLLDMAKLESGRMPINRGVTNLVEIAGRAVDEFSAIAAGKGIRLELKASNGVSRVYVDSQRIYQVLSNLITNAIKYTDKGGSISLSLCERQDDVAVVVEDSGVGIAAEHQRHIFNKFYQISRQAGPGYNGSGLGLALSSEIIAAHDGKIWVESEIGKGSKFYFSLPKTSPQIVLSRHLKSLAERADKKGEQFAMIVVRLEMPQEYVRQHSDAIDDAMKRIVIEGNKIMTTSSDMVIRCGQTEVAIILSQTGKRYLRHIRRMLHIIVDDAMLALKDDSRSVAAMMGMALYPNDALTVEELERKATDEMNKLH
jgi:PAS domain S-box-containing protein